MDLRKFHRKRFTRRKPLSKNSERGRIITECSNLLREFLKIERGERCELCCKNRTVGLFHILPVGTYPRLRFHEKNILLSCWMPCHYTWHHNHFKARKIYERIQELRGKDFERDLKIIERIQPKMSLFHLKEIRFFLDHQLKGAR